MQRNIKIDAINPYLVCTLCSGYLIDATTLVECLHSFCRSCLLRYLESSYNCPKCAMEIHKTKPLEYIRSDPCLQEIVYKLVPDLFAKEESRRHIFKKQDENTDAAGPSVIQEEPPDDSRILVTLKYFRGTSRMERIKTEKVLQMFPTRYLCCNPEMPVRVLKKFVCLKFDISPDIFHVELWRGDETLVEELTLKQLIQIYGLYRERKPLDLHFSLYPKFDTKPSKDSVTDTKRNIPKFDAAVHMRNNEGKDGEENDVPNTIKQEEIKEESESTSEHKGKPPMQVDTPIAKEEKSAPESITKINQLNEQLAKQEEVDDRAGTSRLDENLILKEELKKLTSSASKNNLNTTDSDSSQKSNVSSLDVNLLMDDDFKPETLENDFLKLFDSDSQHNSDIDVSCFDGNLSIDSDMEKISKTLGNDILNLFSNDSQYGGNSSIEQDITNLPKDTLNDVNPFMEVDSKKSLANIEGNAWKDNKTEPTKPKDNASSDNKSKGSNDLKKSELFIPMPTINVPVEELNEDIPESPLVSDTSIPKLPELTIASNLHCDKRNRNSVTQQKPDRICLSSTPTTGKDIGKFEASNTSFKLTESKDLAITNTISKSNFDMSKLHTELTSENPINEPVSNKNNIDDNNLKIMSNPSISPIEPGLIMVDNSETTFESDIIIKLLESDTQNDSDVNSSAENDINDISASLEKDLLNLMNSEGCENLDNSVSNVNVPINVPIASFSMSGNSSSISTQQLHSTQKYENNLLVEGSMQYAISTSISDIGKEDGSVQCTQPFINTSPHTTTSNANNITSGGSLCATLPNMITPSTENEYTNRILNQDDNTGLSNMVIDNGERGENILIDVAATVGINDNTALHSVNGNDESTNDYPMEDKVAVSTEEYSRNSTTYVDEYRPNISTCSVQPQQGVDSIDISSYTSSVVSGENNVGTVLSASDGNASTGSEQPINES